MARLRISGMILSVAFILMVRVAPLQAQSPRISLIEEATNASCGPCAAQNPTFEAWIHDPANSERLVTIIWHANWPGPDVMNAANPEMHDARTSYYGITGVPNAVVNGLAKMPGTTYGIGPASTAILDSLVGLVDATTSPITLTVVQTESDGAVTADVTIQSAEPLTNAILQIVVVEGYHHYENAGFNGEKEFYRIAREQIPGIAGTALNLSANEPLTVPVSFAMDPEWDLDEIYLVAFVQDKFTKEVLQAAEAGPFDIIGLEFEENTSMAFYEEQANTAHEFSNSFRVPADGEYGYTLDPSLPESWQTEVFLNDQPLSDQDRIPLTKEQQATVRLKIIPADGVQRYGIVNLSVNGPQGATGTFQARMYSAPIDVLMYTHDEGGVVGSLIKEQYRMALESAENWNFSLVTEGDEELFDPSDFPIFAFEKGKKSMTESEVSLVKSYLDQGGRLWILGSEIGFGLADPGATSYYKDKAFLNNYLHADYVADDANPATTNHLVYGFSGDPIGDGLMMKINDSKVKNQDQPDVLKAVNGGVPCFYYADESEVAGIRYAGEGYAVVYYGFGIEGIKIPSWYKNITTRTLDWLTSVTSVSGPPSAADGFSVAAYPNPATGATRIPLTLTKAQDVSVAIYNVYGQRVATVFEGHAAVGTTGYHVDTQSLPAGAYVIRAHAGGNVATSMLSVVR